MNDAIRPKVLVTKIGFDGHDRGSRVVAAYLRDAGMEVIYTPPWQEIAAVVKLATEEDVDVIGISSLATDHLIVPKLMAALRAADLGEVGVIVGGIVPDEDEQALLASGVAKVFHPGASLEGIAQFVREGRRKRAPHARRHEESEMNKPRETPPLAELATPLVRAEDTGRQRMRRRSATTGRSSTAPASRSSRCIRRTTGMVRRYDDALGFPGQPPYTRGIYPDDAPRPHLDAAPAHRARHARRLQRAPARPPRPGRDRGVAHPVQLGVPRLRHGRGARRAARHLRHGGQ